MTIEERLAFTEQRYNNQQELRNKHLKNAEDCLTEMTKLQGEYRLLAEMNQLSPSVSVINEAKPKKASKK